MIMSSGTWREKLTEELRDYAIISAYFFVCFGAILLYKAVLLRESGIDFVPLSTAAVKALILGKFALLARSLPIRLKDASQAVIMKLLVNTLLLYLVLITLSVAEEFIVGWAHGDPFTTTLAEFQGMELAEKLSASLLVLLVLVPAVGVAEISAALGPGKLTKLLFAAPAGTSGDQAAKFSGSA
jgi:hypothetical protein